MARPTAMMPRASKRVTSRPTRNMPIKVPMPRGAVTRPVRTTGYCIWFCSIGGSSAKVANKHHADQEDEDVGGDEIAVLEQMRVQERLGEGEGVNQKEIEGDRGHHCLDDDLGEENQSSNWPRSSIICSAAMARLRLAKPRKSKREDFALRLSGMVKNRPTKASTPIGRLI